MSKFALEGEPPGPQSPLANSRRSRDSLE
ncbi:hypothetical protein CGRA01v4_02464 [Colletotrichum graminicola]|nr:hypothetical protein CGRA01v4_02464 [Colletotrichum graminicola]